MHNLALKNQSCKASYNRCCAFLSSNFHTSNYSISMPSIPTSIPSSTISHKSREILGWKNYGLIWSFRFTSYLWIITLSISFRITSFAMAGSIIPRCVNFNLAKSTYRLLRWYGINPCNYGMEDMPFFLFIKLLSLFLYSFTYAYYLL